MDAILSMEKLSQKFIGEEKIKSLGEKLEMNRSRMKNFREFLKYGIIEGIFLMIGAMIILAQFLKGAEKIDLMFLLAVADFFAPLFLNYLFVDIVFENRKRQKEEMLTDLLLEASIFCDESSVVQTIRKISEQDFLLLGEDFARAYLEIKKGASPQEALARIKQYNHSKSYSRVIDIFIQAYENGAKISETLKETAEDLLESKAIIKERQAVMLVTKYTLILAAGIIVPAVLGLIVGLVSGLNFSAMGDLSIGLGPEERKILFQTAISGTTIYVLEYSLISSFFLALQEGNKKNFWIYSLILAPAGMAVFYLAGALK